MVATTEDAQPKKVEPTKEVADAKAAKKQADPKKDDPTFMPNIEPQTGDGGKASTKKVAATDIAPGMSQNPTESPQASNPDSVDVTTEGDATETVNKGVKAKRSNKGGVTLDPASIALLPGNTVSFVAEEREGRVQAKIITGKDSWLVAASNGGGDARVSKILEVAGEITVEFYEDGELYASGTWPVG